MRRLLINSLHSRKRNSHLLRLFPLCSLCVDYESSKSSRMWEKNSIFHKWTCAVLNDLHLARVVRSTLTLHTTEKKHSPLTLSRSWGFILFTECSNTRQICKLRKSTKYTWSVTGTQPISSTCRRFVDFHTIWSRHFFYMLHELRALKKCAKNFSRSMHSEGGKIEGEHKYFLWKLKS